MSALSNAFSAVRRFTLRPTPDVRCELCSAVLPQSHEHLFDARARSTACACTACAVLFASEATARYTRLSPASERLTELEFGRPELERLGIPVTLVCLCPSALHARVFAQYPSRAGVVDGLVALSDWHALVAAQPALAAVAVDRDALLVDARGARATCIRLSMDRWHHMLGLLREQPGSVGFAAFEAALHAMSGGARA